MKVSPRGRAMRASARIDDPVKPNFCPPGRPEVYLKRAHQADVFKFSARVSIISLYNVNHTFFRQVNHFPGSPRAHLHVVELLQFMLMAYTNRASPLFFFFLILSFVSVFMALSTVFHFIDSPKTLCFFSNGYRS